MKVLLIDKIHHKNRNALLNYKNIELTIINNVLELSKYNLNDYDVVFSPSNPIDTGLYPSTKFIFGPHFSVFPDNNIIIIKNINSIYCQPSKWVVDFWKKNALCNDIKIEILPFGVDTDKFKSIKSINVRDKVFIYFKNRNPADLDYIKAELNNRKIEYEIFSYKSKYNEDSYLNYLQNAKYGIWISGHESQGFALEEALSCDVPLIVWNVKCMSQEYGSRYPKINATTVPYWNNECGEIFYNKEEFNECFDSFINNIEKYKPRNYILDNLSIDRCEQYFIDIINNSFIS